LHILKVIIFAGFLLDFYCVIIICLTKLLKLFIINISYKILEET